MAPRAPLPAIVILGSAICWWGSAGAAEAEPENLRVVGHVLEPASVAPTDVQIARLRLPAGFTVQKFADGLVNPRMLAVAPDGTVYVTRRSVGDVVMLRDTDGDGTADLQRRVASRPDMHGIAIHGQRMFLATVNDVFVADIRPDGALGELTRIIADLPDGGQHPNRTLAVGPDGKLYISVGSTCNACAETNPESATILQASLDGRHRRIFASGLRNTIGFDWEPETGQLYGFDHGIDWLGDNAQQEELNRIEDGRKYGWPYVYGDGHENPQDEPPGGIPPEVWAAISEAPVLGYTPHAAPMQMAFYDGDQFPAEYRGDAFVAMRGSWNRKPPSGYEIVRIDFENGEPQRIEPFVSGFLVARDGGGFAQLGRLAGLAVTPDGALLVSDDENGVIYRVSHGGGAPIASAPESTAPAAGPVPLPKPDQARASVRQLAMNELGSRGNDSLDLASVAFDHGGAIPGIHSEYGEGISPPLSWSPGPAGTKSYALILEDPDVGMPRPFVHWVVYNIPTEVRVLRGGLPTAPRLELPDGVLQGRNTAGSTGYFGMKPPADGVHRYHFQLFALDRMIDVPPGADRDAVLTAIRPHVLARGVLLGEFAKPQEIATTP